MMKEVMDNNGEGVKEALEACQKGMATVGDLFEKGEYFVGDLIYAGEIDPRSRSNDRNRDGALRRDTLVGTGNEHPQKSALWKKLRVLLRGPICIRNDRSSYDRGRAVQLWMWNNNQTFCMQQSGRQPYGIRQRCI